MGTEHFLKGACTACGGHLEFPATGAGQDITCPHCGQRTKLLPGPATATHTGKWWKVLLALLATLAFLGSLVAFWVVSRQPNPHGAAITNSAIVAAAPLPTNPMPAPVAPQPAATMVKPGETLTNDFIITPGHLEPTPGSSLVYVTGKVRNPTDRQRFGVKIRFALLDASGAPIGSATDYQSVIDPHGEWAFKAMVMESKTVATRLSAISEDK